MLSCGLSQTIAGEFLGLPGYERRMEFRKCILDKRVSNVHFLVAFDSKCIGIRFISRHAPRWFLPETGKLTKGGSFPTDKVGRRFMV